MRDSNLELLRIVAMFMVIISHFFVHTDFPNNDEFTLNNIIIDSLGIGKIGVAIFVLLSGYFLINRTFDGKKLIKIATQVWFYGVSILAISYVTGIGEITSKIFYRSILPFTSTNWFARVYLSLLLVYPLLNLFIKKISKKNLEKFIVVFGVLWTVLPMLTLYSIGNVRITTVYLYVIGVYLRLYGVGVMTSIKNKVLLVVGNSVIILGSVIAISYFAEEKTFLNGYEDALLSYNSIFLILLSVGIFLIFKDLKITYNSRINTVSQTMFGIYLIHDNGLLRSWIWNDIFKGYRFYESDYLLLYGLFCSTVVFFVCGTIEYFRGKYIETQLFKNFDTQYEYWKMLVNSKIRMFVVDNILSKK